MASIRQAAVAGRFYPGDAEVLTGDLRAYLDAVDVAPSPVPKALIAPHAGYVYSGPVAASAYKRLEAAGETISRVVLLGPCHHVAVRGLAATSADAYETPLGRVPLDKQGADDLTARFSEVQTFDAAHLPEHSLEVHLPFLQTVLNEFQLLPLVVGEASPSLVADVLDAVWGGPETLIVVSSDLSHYLTYEAAKRRDADASRAIETLDGDALADDQACGRYPVKGLLALAKRKGLQVETLDLRNSGDTAGDKDRVVGYGSWAFTEPPRNSTPDYEAQTRRIVQQHGRLLIKTAVDAIQSRLATGASSSVDLAGLAPELAAPGASFVTLKRNGRLRGCIGSVIGHQPLLMDVAANAVKSAFQDPRFSPLSAEEKEGLELSVSVLSPHWPIEISDEADLLRQLRPGVDGLIIEDGRCRALFLPSVWRELAEPEVFLSHLKQKAGLPSDHWSDSFRAERFVSGEVGSSAFGGLAQFWTP